jgi:hypothetical protein
LGYLIALGEIRIEVLLSCEDALFVNLAPESESRSDGQAHGRFVGYGKRTGQAQTSRTHVSIRLGAEGRRAPAKQLRRGEKLGVYFEPNDDFVVGHRR